MRVFGRPAAFLVLIAFILLFSRSSGVLVISQPDSQVIGSFIEWFGVLYGLLLALVTVTVWEKFDKVAAEIDKEADALYLLFRTACYLPVQNIKQEIWAAITEYARYVTSAEVDQKRQRGQTTDNEAEELLDSLHKVCGEALASDAKDAICRELLSRLNEVLDTRGDRIAHAKETIPATFWRLVIATSLIWLVSFFGLGIENDWIALFITGGTVFTILSLAEIIRDLDHPYSGEWKVSFESFEHLMRLIERLAAENE